MEIENYENEHEITFAKIPSEDEAVRRSSNTWFIRDSMRSSLNEK